MLTIEPCWTIELFPSRALLHTHPHRSFLHFPPLLALPLHPILSPLLGLKHTVSGRNVILTAKTITRTSTRPIWTSRTATGTLNDLQQQIYIDIEASKSGLPGTSRGSIGGARVLLEVSSEDLGCGEGEGLWRDEERGEGKKGGLRVW